MIRQEKCLYWKKLFLLQISVLQKSQKEELSSSKLNEKEEQLTKLIVRNFNMEWKLWKRKQVKITPACPTDGKLLKMLPCAQK